MKIKLTFWKTVFLAVMAIGAYGTFVRFTQGLGPSTNLSDQFPWGIWIGFDVLCGVMLAAGGFTLTAAVHIFTGASKHRFPSKSVAEDRYSITPQHTRLPHLGVGRV